MLRDGGRVSGSSLGSLPGERVLEDSGRACGTETSYFKFSINVDLNQLLYLYKTKAKFLLSHVDIQFFSIPFLYHVFLLSLSKVVSSVFVGVLLISRLCWSVCLL